MKLKELLNEEETENNFKKVTQWIAAHYNEMKVARALDDEILNWLDDDWGEDGEYEDEYEWYNEYGGGEAEDAIVEEIIINAKKTLKIQLPFEEHIKVDEWIRDKFNLRR